MDPLCSAMIYLNPLKPAEEGRFEIFNQVHYQLCYFGYLKRGGGWVFHLVNLYYEDFGDSENRTRVILMQTERNTIILCPLLT